MSGRNMSPSSDVDPQMQRERARTERMERITFRVPKSQLEAIEALVESGVYPNRSEAIRHGVRDLLHKKQ